jgi:hypothetical protein
MAFVISPIPQATAVTVYVEEPSMISTSEMISRKHFSEEQEIVSGFLLREEVKELLQKNGVSAEEAQKRLATLSEREVLNLSEQVKSGRAGGDVLTTILLVLLIIFLIQRV